MVLAARVFHRPPPAHYAARAEDLLARHPLPTGDASAPAWVVRPGQDGVGVDARGRRGAQLSLPLGIDRQGMTLRRSSTLPAR